MATSITALNFTQPTPSSGQVNFSATITDATNPVLALSYQWQAQGDSTWHAATTNGPSSITASGAGVSVSGTWNLDKDYVGPLTTGTFSFRIVAVKPAVAAAGSVTAVAADPSTGIKEADAVTIGGRIYEFTTDANIGVGHVAVLLPSATATAAQVKTAIITAITGDASATVTAVSDAGQLVTLQAKTAGAAGNVAITQSIANATTLTPVGLSNGADSTNIYGSASFTGGTGTVGIQPDVDVPTAAETTIIASVGKGSTVVSYTLDQFGKYPAGVLPQAYLKKQIAYECLDLLRAGTRSKFEFVADRAGLGIVRGVLVSTAEWNRIRGTTAVKTILKSKQWLANYANKGLSIATFFENDTQVYAISDNSAIVNGVVQQVVIAYLMSGTLFTALAD